MKQSGKLKVLTQYAVVACMGVVFMLPVGVTQVAYAQGVGEQVDDEISTRGVRGKSSSSRSRVIKKVMPSNQTSSTAGNQQIQALQKQVNVLQAQVNALREVIQVSNDTTTVQSKHIRIQGESVTVKSLKHGVTIEAKKDLNLESKRHMTVKATVQVDLEAGANLKMKGGALTSLRGSIIKLNNGGKPVAKLGSRTISPPVGGPGTVTSGSPTVFVP